MLEGNYKLYIPPILILALMVILSIPHTFLSFGIYTPEYIISIIFYLLLFSPRSLPFLILILLGLVYDLVMHYPLGLNVILFLYVSYTINLQRKFLLNKNFYTVWMFFVMNIIVILLLKLSLLKFSYSLPIKHNYGIMIYRIYFTSLLYPLIHYIFDKVRRI